MEQGPVRVREVGSGLTLVFVHGILANATLWRDVIARLSGVFRCVVPELPLGGHSVPMKSGADLSPFHFGARYFGERFMNLLAGALRSRSAQRLLLKTVAKRHMDAETLDAYFAPLLRDAGVRRDLRRFLAQISNRYTLEAAKSFPSFRGPVLIAWGQDDPFFSSRLALRLRRDFPDATLEFVPGSRAFVPEDRPERLAALIEDISLPRLASSRT